jgi:arylsulfatase A-like enzyme
LPEYFRQNGYETAATGKVFDFREVDKKHDERSWSVPYIRESARGAREAKAKISAQASELQDSSFVDYEICNNGLELLERCSQSGKPFFVAVGIHKPHLPFIVPKKYWDLYDRRAIAVHPFQEHAKNAPAFAFQPGWELRNYDDIIKEGPIPADKQKELIHGYYAAVSFVDVLVGKLLEKVEALGLKENTIVILWGDHGWHLGDHGMWNKHSNFEQATRSPLIISAPGIPGPKTTESVTEFLDVFPTVCELAGVDAPKHLEGVSLVPVMKNPGSVLKSVAVSQFHRDSPSGKVEGYAFRDNRYRYVEWLPIDVRTTHEYDASKVIARELYDYEKDPLETVNVADDPEYNPVVVKMKRAVEDYFTSFRSR